MPRYGFSNRWAVSPFSSQEGVPDVTSEDYSYITSADLEDHGIDVPRPYAPHSHFVEPHSHFVPPNSQFDALPHSAPPPTYGRQRPEDDVLLIKHKSINYPEHFPAYSIGDGKLLVSDLRERIKIILDLSDRQAKRIKLYYKGRRLKKADLPVREYGVKNNSEVLMVLGESSRGSGSETSEELVGAGRDERERYDTQGNSPRVSRAHRWEDRGPRASGSQVGLDVPMDDSRKRATSRVRTQSPGSGVSAASAPAASPSAASPPTATPVGKPGGPIEKLNGIATDFNNNWLPLCLDYIARTPSDPKKRVDEHRRISESVLQQTLLKLDAIDTSTEEGARARRRALVVEVQGVLNKMDAAKSAT
ncbi:BAG domain-containing protein [Chaetomium sp. MPI-CAGE-AT-0009]|nr:BAG domain-containing protein [Chaetomium sp. MPI-CAGE-AT-0009]